MSKKMMRVLPVMLLFFVIAFTPADKVKATTPFWIDMGNFTYQWYDSTTDLDIYANTGTATDPYEIYNEQDLAALSYYSNLSQASGGSNFTNKYIHIIAGNLDMSQYEWTAIGRNRIFYGTVYGNGVVINNLILGGMGNTQNYAYCGLFGRLGGAAAGIHLENIQYYLTITDNPLYVGGFAALSYGSIKDSTVNSGYIVLDSTSVNDVGGFVGNASTQVTMADCGAMLDIKLVYNSSDGNFGGFAGSCTNQLECCWSSGHIYLEGSEFKCGGGFAGYGCGGAILQSCKNDNQLEIMNGSNVDYLGGFIGRNPSTVMECGTYGDIMVNSQSFIGCNGGFTGGDEIGGVYQNCDCGRNMEIVDTENKYSGGFVGWSCSKNYMQCYFQGIVHTEKADHTGGFAGAVSGGNFYQCSAEGDVCSDNSTAIADRMIGGFAGYCDGVVVQACKANCTISAGDYMKAGGFLGLGANSTVDSCYTVNDVYAGMCSKAGGFFGEADSMDVVASYSSNNVYAGSSSYVGGAIGYAGSSNTIQNMYWNKDKVQSVNGTARTPINNLAVGNMVYIGNIIGISDSIMQSSVFVGFLNSSGGTITSWTRSTSINSGYPYF